MAKRQLFFLTAAILLVMHVKAHNTLGLHELNGENPSGDPALPEITGPFRLVFDVIFEEIRETTTFYSLFHWSGTGTDGYEDSIYVGHRNRPSSSNGARTELQIRRGDDSTKCRAFGNLSTGKLYTFTITLLGSGSATMDISGTTTSCPNANSPSQFVPIPLVRGDHFLGKSPKDGVKFQRLKGGISGLQLTNLNDPQHPRNTFKFWNFPGQPYGQGFVVSFYARFDKLNGRYQQAVFDFGNGAPSNNIWCGQHDWGSGMECGVYDGSGTFHAVHTDPGTIEQGKFAFWHFGVVEGRYWIQKNGSELVSVPNSFLPNFTFRESNLFVDSNWGTSGFRKRLDGVVLGTRLDRAQVS